MQLWGNTGRIFAKMLKYDTKRFYSNKALLIIACVVPIILIITLLGSLLPILFRGAELNEINIALFNEDPTFETNMIVRHLTESDSVEGFVDVIDVKSLEEGMELLEAKEASALIHIPQGLQEHLYKGKSETLYFYEGNKDKQIVRLLYDMLNGGLNNINQAQKSVDIVYYAMQDMGYTRQQAAEEYGEMAQSLFTNIISRSDIFKDYNEVSATGDYLNIEYYLISTLLLSLFFLSLPICTKLSKDSTSGVIDRGGFYQSSFAYFCSKILSGSLYLILPITVCMVFILIITGAFGLFSGNVILLILSAILSAIYFSLVMSVIGIYSNNTTNAVWIGFSAALIISMISGIFIPRELMPRAISNVAELTGLPSIIRLLGTSMFGVRSNSTLFDFVKLAGIFAALFIAGYVKTGKRLIRI